MLDNSDNNNISIHRYDSIVIIYHPFVDPGLSEGNIINQCYHLLRTTMI